MIHSKLKKFLSSVVVMALIVTMVPTIKAHAVGTHFDPVTVTFTVSGNGPMNVNISDYYKEDIRYVEIEDGVTSIGERAFSDCSGLKSVPVPAKKMAPAGNNPSVLGSFGGFGAQSNTSATASTGITLSITTPSTSFNFLKQENPNNDYISFKEL